MHGRAQRVETATDRVRQVLLMQLREVVPVGIDQALLHRARTDKYLQRRMKVVPMCRHHRPLECKKVLRFIRL